ncbi:hypothetical protein H6G54_15845 [Anabaena cylindrica FACHB-243]|uniref:Uncharacterized protein n=1 Tax=Anabaena cylindrica (strain ATCC 27899 / PCC 7122) TaxID=272123 RepID=K9ZFV5_ANACC|nr:MULTISPECIES: hypothetical protein [Anabaena]AFZ58081.1 hypothetical protein Anacy_2641 [Anabaena cylindrica PCC 7122]MBD2419144.1 hypothetical protein [Anabaena cylindrica FACHB-243]MBY5284035.1 hypothetical protein [Anabaena sp. CCAP 1446/1C]MBY5306828.1 hypothetical protein [Anabaena sp. CCAP 1446/1C]MCM2409615.1 hypothetical protein [Anabaena sp. CCAP 1446/1C]
MNYLSVSDSISQLLWHLPVDITFLAQQVRDADLMGQVQRNWNHFVQTGQIWALLIGLVIGYMLKSLTSYG